MPGDQLIQSLVSDLRPVRPRRIAWEAAFLGVIAVIELGLFLAAGNARPDIAAAATHAPFWWKLAGSGLLALLGVGTAILSFDPARSPRRGLRWVPVLLGACALAGWIIDVAQDGWPAMAARVQLGQGLQCILTIAGLSLPPLLGLGLLMRRGAPTDVGGTALAVGIAAAAWGTFVFVFACPHDDPLWVALWYGLSSALVALSARLILPRLARW